ncbi:MAG TPA: gliding motility lipoprotein GldH [Puia sp.]|nr:gliding motility lipoprotein GldH [Puia sp.]
MKNLFALLLIACSCDWSACTPPSGVFEKDIVLPGQQWESNFRPTIDFTINPADTNYRYNVYLVLRHTDAYNYNNIWIRGTVKQPGDTAAKSERYDLLLATNDKGWLGSGMDDIYEHRVEIQQETKFSRPGTYSFTLEQVMREDPLKHVLDIGVRIEKAP